jgi:hypothetical protein
MYRHSHKGYQHLSNEDFIRKIGTAGQAAYICNESSFSSLHSIDVLEEDGCCVILILYIRNAIYLEQQPYLIDYVSPLLLSYPRQPRCFGFNVS